MEPRQFGDYRLENILAEEPGRTTWLARQLSVRRAVVLVELTDLSRREEFLADVRAKAAVDHPLIASVYEAVSEPDRCLVVLESIPAQSLDLRRDARAKLPPVEIAHVLKRTAEAMRQIEGSATLPLTLGAIRYDNHGLVRIENLAVAGDPDPARQREDVVTLGRELVDLVAEGRPGANRVLTVLAWMRGQGLDQPIDWKRVEAYGEQIENQLAESVRAIPGPGTVPLGKRKLAPVVRVLAGVALAVAVGAGIAFWPSPPRESAADPADSLPAKIEIPGWAYPSPDGGVVHVSAFRIATHETTVGEYREFLQSLDELPAGERGKFDAPDQPETKRGHRPDGWRAMLAAERAGGKWRGRPISMRHPVVEVDWWDAVAYCNWKSSLEADRTVRLPTQEEWFAALGHQFERPESLEPSGWSPVTEIGPGDRTPGGLRGMAGSVAEWILAPAVNPANPLGKKQHVIIGGSHLEAGEGALTRRWTDDRGQRRDDLGFRVVDVVQSKS